MKKAAKGDTLKAIVRRFAGPVLLLLVAIACGHVPSEADGATLAGVPNIVWILLNVCLTCYAFGMIHGRLTANAHALPDERSDNNLQAVVGGNHPSERG